MIDANGQSIIGQGNFSGGMNCLAQKETQYRDSRNVVIRDGYPTTRPGIRRYLKVPGFIAGFWFNQDAAKVNDATHTGFWFPFDFVRYPEGAIQGCGLIRLSTHTSNKIIFAVDAVVYLYEDGWLTEVAVAGAAAFTDDETVDFTQANDKVYMFRDGDKHPCVWDGSATGFVSVPAGTGDEIPHGETGLYHAGRMWIAVGDDIYASAALDFDSYDYTNRNWSAWKGQEETGVILYPWHEDAILLFKRRRVALLTGINSAVLTGTSLADYVAMQTVDVNSGAIAAKAICTIGENVWYLGYGGIYSLARNMQNKMMLNAVAMSVPVQIYIDRINWASAPDCACATVHDNYVLFAVPVDGATHNNLCLVYDSLLETWVGAWESTMLTPVKFFHDNENLIFLSHDNAVRKMFTGDPWDSEAPYDDTPAYDAARTYEPGEYVYYENAGDRIYECLTTSMGNLPTDATYWADVTDIWGVYQLTSMLETRQFALPPDEPGMRFSRTEVKFRHQNPLLTVETFDEDHGTDKTIFADQEYPQTEWDVVEENDWDATNVNLDANDPHRKDYTLFVGASGIYADENGLYAEVWETHGLRWIPINVNTRSLGCRVTNVRGKMKILGMKMMVSGRRFAGMMR